MAVQLTLDGLAFSVLEHIGAYLLTGCLSCFRNVNAANRQALRSTVVNALARGGCKGLSATPWIAEKGNAGAITAVIARLNDEEASVREAAVNVLAQITQKGNPNVITAMRALLEDAQPEVRAPALNAGLLIAEDQQIITERYEALDHARFELS